MGASTLRFDLIPHHWITPSITFTTLSHRYNTPNHTNHTQYIISHLLLSPSSSLTHTSLLLLLIFFHFLQVTPLTFRLFMHNGYMYRKTHITTQEKRKRVFIPSNWDHISNIDVDLYDGTIPIKDSKHSRQLLKYLLHGCYTSSFYRDDAEYPLSAARAGTICNGDKKILKPIRAALEEANIIVCDYEAKKGVKSYHYSLHPDLIAETWTMTSHYEVFKVPKSKYQIQWEGSEGHTPLDVDETILEQAISYTASEKGWGSDKDDRSEYWYSTLAHEWDNEIYRLGKTGRVYGSWSNIPKELRGVFTIAGEETVEVDFKSSQPTILVSLYEDKLDEECQKYIKTLKDGFYEEIIASVSIDNRELIKERTMAFLCGKKKSTPEIDHYFKTEFPKLYARILDMTKNDYRELAWYLQKIESGVVVDRVCKKHTAFSMHDAVICKKTDAQAIRKTMVRELRNVIGIDPVVTIEDKRAKIMGHKKP